MQVLLISEMAHRSGRREIQTLVVRNLTTCQATNLNLSEKHQAFFLYTTVWTKNYENHITHWYFPIDKFIIQGLRRFICNFDFCCGVKIWGVISTIFSGVKNSVRFFFFLWCPYRWGNSETVVNHFCGLEPNCSMFPLQLYILRRFKLRTAELRATNIFFALFLAEGEQ